MADLTKGFGELAQELSEIAKYATGPAKKDALEDGAEIIVNRARSLVPYSTRRKGLLKKTGITKGDNTGDKIDVGWTQEGFYGRFLEHGTSKMAPRPHISPAWEQTQTQVINTMLTKLKLK